MSWVIGPDPRDLASLLSPRFSGLDPGDGAVSVICDPNRVAADRDGARFGTDLDRGALDLAALEVDLADRVVGAVGDPDGAGAGVDPSRMAADFDRVDDRAQRWVDFRDRSRAAVGDPDEAAGDGDSRRAAADADRFGGDEALGVDPADDPRVGDRDPEAVGPPGEPQSRHLRRQPSPIEPGRFGGDVADALAGEVGKPDPLAAKRERSRFAGDPDFTQGAAAAR